jgi:UPF0716 protein FxsA
MLPILLVLFIVVPIAELYVIIQVGQAIGVLPTIALLLLDSIVGSLLLRTQGRAAWRRFQAAVAEGRVPTKEVLDGVLVVFGGALLLTPGFITDVFGIIFLLPPTRALVRRVALANVAARMAASATKFARPPVGRASGRFTRPGADYDVDGTATETPPRREQLP